jgi:hypothetical protein
MAHALNPASTQIYIVGTLCNHRTFNINNSAKSFGDFPYVESPRVFSGWAFERNILAKVAIVRSRRSRKRGLIHSANYGFPVCISDRLDCVIRLSAVVGLQVNSNNFVRFNIRSANMI